MKPCLNISIATVKKKCLSFIGYVLLLTLSGLAVFGQNKCPVTDPPEPPFGSTANEYFDDTEAPAPDKIEIWRESWMSQLEDSRLFNNITIPGTHQSSSRYWSGWSQCNTWSITTQLEAGLRYFDVRTDQIYDELQVWHGIIDQFNCLDNIIQDMVTFLEKNSDEFIMMRLDDYNNNNEGNTLTYTEAVLNITDQYNQDYFWKEPVFPSTVGDVRGKIIIFRNWDDPDMWGLQYGENSFITDDYDIENRADLEAKWDGVEEHLNSLPNGSLDTLYIVFNSGAGVLWTPSRVAQETNSRMYGYLPELECPSRRGVILFDFPGYAIIGDVISFNADLNNCKSHTIKNL